MDDRFRDRLAAGEQLATALQEYRGSNSVVLGMARGGVAVGYAVAKSLDLALEALVVRKLGAPQNPELAIGAVSETGALWLDQNLVQVASTSSGRSPSRWRKRIAVSESTPSDQDWR
jgi:putative phosphoribosyl transferase